MLVGEVAQGPDDLLRGRAAVHGWSFVSLQVVPDDVHAFVRVGARGLSGVAQQFKGYTSRVLHSEF